MRYLRTYPGFMSENTEEVLEINLKKMLAGEKIFFRRKDIALILGKSFNPLSNIHEEVESGAKEMTGEFNSYIVADTDLNAINFIQEREVHLTSDISPIIRAFEIDEMISILKEDNPINFLSENHGKKDKIYRGVMLVVNFQTRERKIIDVIYSEGADKLNEFIYTLDLKGFNVVNFLMEKDIYLYYQGFNELENLSGKTESNMIAYNSRNDYPLNNQFIFSEREVNELLYPLEIFKNDFEEIKARRKTKGEYYYFLLLENLKNRIENEYQRISVIRHYAQTDNDASMIDALSAGRMSLEQLQQISDIVEERKIGEADFLDGFDELMGVIINLLNEERNFDINEEREKANAEIEKAEKMISK